MPVLLFVFGSTSAGLVLLMDERMERKRESARVCVCVCVCVRERDRERTRESACYKVVSFY